MKGDRLLQTRWWLTSQYVTGTSTEAAEECLVCGAHLSRCPVDSSPYSAISGSNDPPSWRRDLPNVAISFHERGLNSGETCLFEDFCVGEEVPTLNIEDGADAVVMDAFKEVKIAAVCDQGFGVSEEGVQYNSSVDADLYVSRETDIV
ncbi:hypothetical protein CHS0354_005027 [Potamilus streckersoni]|uniref:Uncharacterized protein n=1 Tax=Potamilus streckersoni TaxID=2493646 RepID=A0AAE0SSL6_9BIVA|nr:hypothetical protein CHS0354_005027 [Potamilus streckersoni]